MDPIRVLIAEDEPGVRAALSDLIESDEGMEVVGEAADAQGAIDLAAHLQPDVALVDVKMPGGGGSRASVEIREASPGTHVVAISAYEDRRTVLEMLRAGVVGYIVKGTPADDILVTIRRSVRGQGTLSGEITAGVIRELARLLEQSERMARELRQLDRTKRELIQVLSHELFTPITAIQGFAIMVAEHGEDLSPSEIRDLAAGVRRAADRIRRLVGNLNALARLDREGVVVATRPVSVADLLTRAAEQFAEDSRIRMPDPKPTERVLADFDLAACALIVLLENALAFSPADHPVEVDVRNRGELVDLIVSDYGPGIAPEAQASIFDAFTQVDDVDTRSHQGLGIGLYLARRIMAAHGGEIGLEPEEGFGSRFRISFPAAKSASPAAKGASGGRAP